MRQVLSHWNATKGYLNKLINERKIQIDGEEIFMPSLVQKDTIDEFVRSGYLNADFMNFLSKKYRGKKLLE
ncbi:MAG: hypothetical protein LBG04_01050 [Holosporaceae bacterium]|jgi:hypothetical protein|nr:hypothetical protein [Holosporaceae bacterium]